MRHATLIRWSFGLLAAVLTAGCTSAVFSQPEVTLQNVQLGGLGLSGGTLLVNLQVVNPNRFSLNANQLSYRLEVRDPEVAADTVWMDFATGVFGQDFSVGPRDTATVQVPVEFNYAALGTAAGSLLRAGIFNYQATGTVDVRTPLGTHQVPFRRRGVFTLAGTQ